MEIRDRYAPSPTGNQHIGGVRTALFNYLFAKSKDGKFILRLEDTDRTRFDEAFVQNLYDTFNWLNIHWDEGPDIGGPASPYIQSERFELYKKAAEELIAKGRAYRCFCSSERLEKIREEREASHSSESGYDRHCRSISPEESEKRASAGEPFVVRLNIPLGESTKFHDHILGDIEWKNDDVNPDPVLLKSDGFPTYHLANVVDDHLMNISHVLRAQEWIPSTPLHVIMYRAFGWTPPEYCHLPMVMGQDGKKLSKRHGATSIDEFRKSGYLPEALINYVALLGASYEEGKEIYTLKELAERFSLDKLNKAPAIFDYKKLEWYNGQYIRMMSDADLAEAAWFYARNADIFGENTPEFLEQIEPYRRRDSFYRDRVLREMYGKKFLAAMPLIKERISFLHEVPEKIAYLFSEPAIPAAEEFIPKKADLARTIELLTLGREIAEPMAALNDIDAENLIKAFCEEKGVRLGDIMMPLRVAITCARVSPPLFGSIRILGAKHSLERIDAALSSLSASLNASKENS
jgi:glutamyl-tRNA synthetase